MHDYYSLSCLFYLLLLSFAYFTSFPVIWYDRFIPSGPLKKQRLTSFMMVCFIAHDHSNCVQRVWKLLFKKNQIWTIETKDNFRVGILLFFYKLLMDIVLDYHSLTDSLPRTFTWNGYYEFSEFTGSRYTIHVHIGNCLWYACLMRVDYILL